MSMLLFMPWCRLDRPYDLGCVRIEPFERHGPIGGLDDAGRCRVNAIMASYKTIERKPVDRAALVRFNGKSPIDELTESEVEDAYELVALAAFCGLAGREYFNTSGSYCNSDCFALYVQRFDRADFTALSTRRREGRSQSMWPVDDIAITVPVHCHTVGEVRLDAALLGSLTARRTQSAPDDWARWQNAIACFNQANTDSDNVQHQVEWVLLCSAFEHLLKAKSAAIDVATKFSDALKPSSELLASNAKRRSCRWTGTGVSLRCEWMREFYRIRGDFAHGKLNTQQPAVWNPLEHLVLATIAFPLLVKCRLKDAGRYQLTTGDQAQIDSFESFADTDNPLKPPCDQKSSLDSHWKRLCDERKSNLHLEEAWEKAKLKVRGPCDNGDAACEGRDALGETR